MQFSKYFPYLSLKGHKKCFSSSDEDGVPTNLCITAPIEGTRYLLSSTDLVPGKIFAAFGGISPPHVPRDSFIKVNLPGKTYRIKSRTFNETFNFIFLSHNGNSKYIYRDSRTLEINTGLLWMGDLDKDGKLDLIVDSALYYEWCEMRLLLSSKAKPGELFDWIAQRYSIEHL